MKSKNKKRIIKSIVKNFIIDLNFTRKWMKIIRKDIVSYTVNLVKVQDEVE